MLPVNDALFEYAVPSNSPMHPASYLKSGLGKMPVPVYNGQAPYLLQANQQQIYMQQQQMRLNHQEGGQITNAAPYKNGTDAQRHAGKYPVPVGPHDQYGMGDASQYSYIQPNVYMHQYLGHQMLSASGQIVPNSTPVPPVSSSLSHSTSEGSDRIKQGEYSHSAPNQHGTGLPMQYALERANGHDQMLPVIYQGSAMVPYGSSSNHVQLSVPTSMVFQANEVKTEQNGEFSNQNSNASPEEFRPQQFDYASGKSNLDADQSYLRANTGLVTTNNQLYGNVIRPGGITENSSSNYPSSELLDGIHYSTTKLYESMADNNPRYYAYDSSALLASGVLVHEYVKEALSFVNDDLRLAETIPNCPGMHEGDLFNDFIDSKQPNYHATNDSVSYNCSVNSAPSHLQHGAGGVTTATTATTSSTAVAGSRSNGRVFYPDQQGNSNGHCYSNGKEHSFVQSSKDVFKFAESNEHSQPAGRVSQNVQNTFPLLDYAPSPNGTNGASVMAPKFPISGNANVMLDYGQAHFPPYLHL